MTIHIAKWLFYYLLGGITGIIIERIRWYYRAWKQLQEGGESSQPPSENGLP